MIIIIVIKFTWLLNVECYVDDVCMIIRSCVMCAMYVPSVVATAVVCNRAAHLLARGWDSFAVQPVPSNLLLPERLRIACFLRFWCIGLAVLSLVCQDWQ